MDASGRIEVKEGPLLEAFRADARSGFEAIVESHLPHVVRIAQRFGLNPDEAEDVAQEVFIRVWRGLRGFRGESELRSWILRIAIRESSRYLTRHKRQARIRRLPEGAEEPAQNVESPDFRTLRAESAARLREALAAMSEKHREVVVLHYIEEMPCEEVGRILGCSLGTVYYRLNHARKKLKQLMGTP